MEKALTICTYGMAFSSTRTGREMFFKDHVECRRDNQVSKNQRTVYLDKDRHDQNDKSRGTTLNSATALWDNPTTPLLHITAPPGGSYQFCALDISCQCESRISLQRPNLKFSFSLKQLSGSIINTSAIFSIIIASTK